jgi:hypothetical protein
MAQYTQDYYFFMIDVKAFLTENPSATYQELMRDCICAGLQANFNEDCEYTEIPYSNVNYPAIRIPWHDGSTTNMPILVLRNDATAAVTSSSKTIVFHTSELGNSTYDITVECGSYGAGSGGSLQISTSVGKIFVGAVKENDMMHIGFYAGSTSANPNSVYMHTIMTKMKDRRTDTYKHALIASYLSDVRDVYYDYVKIMIEGEATWTYWYPSTISNHDPSSSSSLRMNGIALISPIDIGTHYHETLHVYPRSCGTLYGEWDTNTSFYASTPEKPWYENAFVVDGVSWDVKRHSANGSSGGYAFSFCKKHVDTNEEV